MGYKLLDNYFKQFLAGTNIEQSIFLSGIVIVARYF